MKSGWFLVLALALAGALALPGCLVVAAAAVAAGAVYVSSDDSAEVHVERTRDEAFTAVEAELDAAGHADVRDRTAGYLCGHVDGAHVEAFLEGHDPASVHIRVKARRNSGVSPAPDVAERIAFAAVKRLGY